MKSGGFRAVQAATDGVKKLLLTEKVANFKAETKYWTTTVKAEILAGCLPLWVEERRPS